MRFLLLCLCFAITKLNAQEQPSLRVRANQLFEQYEYANAALLYSKLVDKKKPRTADMERLASCYFYTNKYDLAENWYARIIGTNDYSESALWNYADVLKQNGKYAEAKKQYQLFGSKYGEDDVLKLALAGADSAVRWMASPSMHKLHNEKAVNTALSEFSLFPMGKDALYAGEPMTVVGRRSGMTGEAYLRIYSTKRTSGEQSLQQPLMGASELNEGGFHVGPVVANRAGNVFYVTRTYSGAETEKHKDKGLRFKRHNLELKVYTNVGGSWREEDFPFNNVKEYSLGHASLSADERILYFASDMPGGQGGVDIWYCVQQSDGNWGAPQNAGTTVNSAGDEMFPSIMGETLYFASNGFAGMGGLDIFSAKGERSSFAGRKNLQFPINSAADDFAFVVSSQTEDSVEGYLSSNRQGGVGSDDIYSFALRRPITTIILEGLVVDKKSGELIPNANITLYGDAGQIAGRKLSDGKAAFSFELKPNSPYILLADKERYHADSASIAAMKRPLKDTVVRMTLRLEPIHEVGHSFVLEDIYYDFDKYNIRKDAAVILDKLVATLRDNPTLHIELSSHTDSRGSDSYNMKLSQNRADSAIDYLVSRGIARERLEAKGYGETRLVNKCANGVSCTVAEHQANRRTEIKVLKY